MDDPTDHFSQVMDHLIVASRIRDLSHYALGDRVMRLRRLRAVLSRLPAGQYVIGVGPHCSDIIKVGESEITLGRPASLAEESQDTVIDYAVNDASLLGPREVSRLHASLRLDGGEGAVMVRDESSSTGTYLLPGGDRLPAGEWLQVQSGQGFSLGPSQVNVFVAWSVA